MTTIYKVVEYHGGSLPVTLDALPGDVEQGEKFARLLTIAIAKFRRGGKCTLETKALGPVTFWETRSRTRSGGVVKYTYHLQFHELKLGFDSPGYHDLRRWVAIASQILGMGYPCIIANFDGSGMEFYAPNGRAMDDSQRDSMGGS